MRIVIEYEASWRNSFLDGSNSESLPKKGRGFVGSMTNLKKQNLGNYSNFIEHKISHDTVMGVLNRLIGDQRKLYQSRKEKNYFFSDIESCISYNDIENKSVINKEIIYIRNMTGNTDQNSFSGMISGNDIAFNSKYSNSLWGVLTLSFPKLCDFINNHNFIDFNEEIFYPIKIVELLNDINKLKPVLVTDDINDALLVLTKNFPDIDYVNSKGMINPREFYCSSLYLQISRLKNIFDFSDIVTKKGVIPGFSKRNFTSKDFMDRFTTGGKKIIWGNPFLLKMKRKGEGEIVSMLTKASGVLEITLSVSRDKALVINEMIEAAAVSSFYIGKKGLAYVSEIRI